MMHSEIFDIFLLFVICCSFVYGSPVGNNSGGEILNPDALTTPLPSKIQTTQIPDKALQGNISANATEIKLNNITITNGNQSKLPVGNFTAKNVTVNVKPVGNDTTVPVTVVTPETTANAAAVNSTTTTTKTPTVNVSTTAAAAAAATATTPTTPTTPTSSITSNIITTTNISTTPSPEMTSASSVSSATVKSEKMENDREFDGPSFIGGIVLAFGLTGIGFVAYKFCKSRMEMSYRHF